MPPLIHKVFSIPELFWKTEGFLYQDFRFGPVRQKIRQNRVAPPLLCMKNFHKRIFLKHHSVFQWNILVQPDKNFSAENRDTALLSIKLFPYQNFSETQNGFLVRFFWSCETEKTGKIVMLPLLCMKLFQRKIFLKHHSVLQWNISVEPGKKFSTETRDTPLLSIKKTSLPENFWNTEWFPGELFSVLWDKKKILIKPWSFPLLCLKFCDTRILSNYRRVHLRMLSALWDKNFSTEFSDIPCAKNLPIHEFFWNTEVLPNEIFRHCVGHKVFDGETWYPLLSDA